MIPPRIHSVKPLDNYILEITYQSKEIKHYDMKKNLNQSFYKNLNNIAYFKMVKSADTTVEWPDGEDIDPNELYENSISVYNL